MNEKWLSGGQGGKALDVPTLRCDSESQHPSGNWLLKALPVKPRAKKAETRSG